MGIKHLLLEVYCDCEVSKGQTKPTYCLNGLNNPGSHCFENECKFLSYTNAQNEIAYVGINGLVDQFDDCVGFGGEMEPELNDAELRKRLVSKWKNICKNKIDEAYDEYMNIKNTITKE